MVRASQLFPTDLMRKVGEPLSSRNSRSLDRVQIVYLFGTVLLVTSYILAHLLCNVKYSVFIYAAAAKFRYPPPVLAAQENL